MPPKIKVKITLKKKKVPIINPKIKTTSKGLVLPPKIKVKITLKKKKVPIINPKIKTTSKGLVLPPKIKVKITLKKKKVPIINPKIKTTSKGLVLPQTIPVTLNLGWEKIINEVYAKAGKGQKVLIGIKPKGGGNTRWFTIGHKLQTLMATVNQSLGQEDANLDEYEEELVNELLVADQIILSEAKPNMKNWQGASFFPYWCTNYKVWLENKMWRYQIFCKEHMDEKEKREIFNDNCFVYACKVSGLFTDEELSEIKRLYGYRKDITFRAVTQFAKDFNVDLHIKRYYLKKGKLEITTKKPVDEGNSRCLVLAQHEKHWFLFETVPRPDLIGKIHAKKVSSLKLIFDMLKPELGMFEPITTERWLMLTNQFFDNRRNIGKLTLNKNNYRLYRPRQVRCEVCGQEVRHKTCCNMEPPASKPPVQPYAIWYGDTETYNVTMPDGSIKLMPYMFCAYGGKNQPSSRKMHVTRLACEHNALGKFFDDIYAISRGSPETLGKRDSPPIRLYFHHMKFDFCQLLSQMVNYDNFKILKKGNQLYQVKLNWKCNGYNGKVVKGCMVKFDIRCSNLLLNSGSLAAAAKTYLDRDAKFPCLYTWYNWKHLDIEMDTLDNIETYCLEQGTKRSDLETFRKFIFQKENADLFVYKDENGIQIRMWKFYEYYCRQDCTVLHDVMEKFRELFRELDLDPFNYLTISSLSQAYYYREGAYENVYELNGVPQMFCQQAVVGGRCMTAYNKAYHVRKRTEDFDGCSLYSSAMMRQAAPTGPPHLIVDGDVQRYDYYIVEVVITKVGKKLPFPVLSIIDENGGRLFNNDMVGKIIVTDSNTLEDFRNFQDGEYQVIRGYGWVGVNNKVQEIVKTLYEMRNDYKKKKSAGDPIGKVEGLIKLILNSAYGKTIMKLSDSETVIKGVKNKDTYIFNNYYNIKQMEEIGEYFIIERYKEKNDHWNIPQFGAAILSMSKKIMNEVMSVAYEHGVDIYYTDTDSMQIDSVGLSTVQEKFREKYGRELVGGGLGQFHCDFKISHKCNSCESEPYSVEGLYLGKKMYACQLRCDCGAQGEHLVMKGIPNELVKWGHYVKLASDQKCEFNLLDAKVGIRTTKFQTTIPLEFKRVVRKPDAELIIVQDQ